MTNVMEVARFLFGDVRGDRGFWYSHVLWEVRGLTKEHLLWTPRPNTMCILWHVAHIACRERLHLGVILQGQPESIIPDRYQIFGDEWATVEQVRLAIGDFDEIFDWARQVREESCRYIETLREEDYFIVPPTSKHDLSVLHWLTITASHTALHIGRIQLLCAMLEGTHERAC